MSIKYKELEIDLALEGIIQVERFCLEEGLNQHAFLSLKLLVETELAEELVTRASVAPVTVIEKERTQGRIIFQGKIETVTMKIEGGLAYLYLEVYSCSKEWDRVEKSQSFLNGADSYLTVARKAVSEYSGADIKDEITNGALIPEMLLQYEETDWVFLRRLASHFGTFLIPDAAADCSRVYFGIPQMDYGMELNREDYILEKDLGHYARVLAPDQILPQEASRWKIRCRRYLWLGEEVTLNRIAAVVTSARISTEAGELVYRYELSRRDGIRREKEQNPRIYGMSIPATVKERSGNRIRVHFDIDPVYEAAEQTKYFTYAIESSSFYCMPEEESRVHIYFPDHEEQSAIAVHAIGSGSGGGGGGGKNPDHKQFSDPSGSAMNMTPENLSFTADADGTALLHMGSNGNISLTGIDINIKTRKGMMAGEGEAGPVQSLYIGGENKVSLMIGEGGGEGITLDTEANIIAAFIRQTADSHPAAEPSGADIEAQLAADDASYREANNNAIKDSMVAQKKESKQKFVKGLKSLATVVAVTALVVCTGGAAAVTLPFVLAAGAKTVFAVADMAEGLDGHSKVNALDTSQPSNFLRDTVFGGNQALYDLTSMGVDIIFDLVSGKALKNAGALKNMNNLMCKKSQVAEMATKVGVDVIGGMVEDYLTTGKIDPVNTVINIGTGMLKGSFGTFAKANILDKFNFDSKAAQKIAGVLIGTGVDTGLDLGIDALLGRETDIKRSLSQNLLANGLAAFYGEPIDAVTGGFLITGTDFILADIGHSIRVTRTYNSTRRYTGVLGKGWSFAYEGRLYQDETRYHAELDTGHHVIFEQEGEQFKNVTSGCGWFTLKKEADTWHLHDRKNHRTWHYDRAGRLTAIEDRNGQALRFAYRGNTLEQMTTALGYSLDFTFREGRLVQLTDNTGRTMQYRYEGGMLTDVVHMDQGITHYDYDRHGYLLKATDQAGVTYLENQYDNRGRVVLQTLANGDTYRAEYREGERNNIVHSSVGNKTVVYAYSREGQPLSLTYQDGTKTEYAYDARGYRISETGRSGSRTLWQYDDAGRMVEEQQSGGLVTGYCYDDDDNLVTVSDNGGRQWQYCHDQNHNRCRTEEKTGSGNGSRFAVTKHEYDRMGRLVSETDALGRPTVYHYEEGMGRPSLIRLPDGEDVAFEYDGAGRKLAEEDACGRTEFGYNARNFRTMLRDGEGNETRYMYDGMGRLLALYPPKAWKEQQGEYSYRYDFLDRRIDTLRPDGSHERLLRDGEGHILKKVHPGAYQKDLDDGEGIRYEYDSDGNQIRIHYPDGGCERMFYDCEGRRIRHVLPEAYQAETDDGKGYGYEYDAAGNLTRVVSPEGNQEAAYTYDLCGNILTYTDAMNRTTHYRYDLRKHLLQVLRPAEEKDGRILYQKISFSYDENGNKTKEVRHGGYWNEEGNLAGKSGTDLCLTFVYDARNRLIRIKDGLGAAVRYCYDVKGNRIHEERQVSDTVKQVIRYTYDRAGRLTEEKEELNSGLEGIPGEDKSAITRYRYDENGNRTEIITPEGYQVLREYDACDRLISERSVDKKNGIDRTAVIAYDKAGNITKVARQGRGSSEWDISYDYDLKDRLTHVEDCLGPVFRYEYNKNDQVVEALLPPAGEQKQQRGYRYRYDHRGNVLEKADTAGTVLEQNEYLADGALARRVTADGNELSYTYGTNGQESEIHTARSKKKEQAAQRYTYDSRGRIIGIADGNQNQTGYAVDGWGRVRQVQGADDGEEGYTYDYAGNITGTTDANGGVITYRYNSQGRVCEIIDQEGNSETFRYDREGRMILHTDRNGNQVKTTYNMDSNPVLETGSDKDGNRTETRCWEYNSLGQTVKSIAGGFCYTYEYRPDGKLLRKAASGRTLICCTYHADGHLKTLTDESGKTVAYGYDWKGNLAGITDEKGGRIATYSHYPDGKLKDIRHFNGVSSHYEYDTDGNISRLTTMIGDHEPLYDFRYEYDLNGNRTAKAGACLFPGEEHVRDTVISYRYDSRNRLLEEDYDGESVSYRYDLCGNRMEKESVAQRETYRYNKKNQMTERTGAKGRTFYQYDLQGNLTEESGSERGRYYYNPFNQQTKAERSDGYIQENLYDGEGLRAGINNLESSARFVFYNGELLTETKEEGGLQSRYVLGYGVAVSEVDGEAGYHAYHLDEQNSTVYITGNQRQVENAYAYDAFGNLRGQAGELLNRILYTGQQYDQEMGQYYLRARYYNPVVGRFTQEDVYRGDGLNLYAYCANNPVIYYDPSGYKYSVNEIIKVLQTDSNGNKYVTNKDYKNAYKTASTSPGNYQGTLQAHHGLQQEWAKSNLAEYGYNPKSAPTTTLESNTAYDKNLPHSKITSMQKVYNNEFGTTSGTLEDRLVIGANQMIDSGVSKDVALQDLENNYKMIDKLNSNSADKIEAGELDQLTYNREKIEAQLHDEKQNEDKENEKCP